MINKKKVFIYDLNGSMSRLVNHYFNDFYQITVCRKAQELKKHALTEFQVAFVVVSEESDLICLYNVKQSISNIFICSDKIKYNQFFEKTAGMIVLNFFTTRTEIIDKIRSNLMLFELSESCIN